VAAVDSGVRPDGALGALVADIEPAVREAVAGGAAPGDLAEVAIDGHVRRSVDRLLDLALVRDRCASGDLAVLGGRYQIDTGEVSLLRRIG